MSKKKEPSLKGKVIKLSRDLVKYLDTLRVERESYDSLLRRSFGQPSRNGHPQPLEEYYVIDTPTDLLIRRDVREARGEAIRIAVKRGQKFSDKQKKESVITVRKVP